MSTANYTKFIKKKIKIKAAIRLVIRCPFALQILLSLRDPLSTRWQLLTNRLLFLLNNTYNV